MKKAIYLLLSLTMVFSLVLTACAPEAEAPVVEEPVVGEPAVEEPEVEEPVVEEPEVLDLAVLDENYAVFLADMEKYNTIGLDALNTALAEEPPFLLDVRSPEEAAEGGHIEGSVLIPLRELGSSLAYLPSFDTPIVSYCGSGWRCTIALTALEAMGWEDVKGLKGGSYGGWKEAGYAIVEGQEPEAEMLSAAEVDPLLAEYFEEVWAGIPEGWGVITAETLNTELAENSELVVIDSRRLDEVEGKGYIEAANWTHIPLEQFIEDQALWPTDLDAPVVVYCGSGHRSTIAMTMLWSYGYTDVRSLKGGFGGWAGEGYPVTGGPADLDAGFSTFLADMEAYNTIGLDALNTAMVEEPPFLLDVRNPEEAVEGGHIEGSVLIPLRELSDSLAYLPSFDTPIVSYCGSGWRCTIALTLLEGAGWEDVKGLKGGSYGGWKDAGYAIVEGQEPEAEMLSAAEVDPAWVEAMGAAVDRVPEGWGVLTSENFNTMLVESPDVYVIDVRRTEELEEKGVIESENWVHMPLESFVEMKADWPAEKDATVVIYCGSGHRSTIAMTMLYAYGYTDVFSLKGGFGGWALVQG